MIREYKITDTNQIIDLFKQTVLKVNSKDYSREQITEWANFNNDISHWEKRLSSTHTYVFEDEIIKGFANLTEIGYLDLLFVHYLHQREGVGGKLMERIIQKAQELKLEQITSKVSFTAKPLFEKFGFIIESDNTVNINGVDINNFNMLLKL